MAMDSAQKTQMLKSNVTKAMSLAPEDPWNQTTPEALGPCITQFIDGHESYFRKWAENWYMTMQYVFGQHNFRWSRRNGFAVDFDWLREKRSPSSYVRAYTNIARIAVESLSSGLYSNMPSWDVEAVDDSATSGRRQKKIVGRLLDGLFKTLQCDKDGAAAAFVFSMFGQMAFESGWNPMAGRVIEQPRYLKSQKPTFTSWMADNPIVPGSFIETPTAVKDPTGRPYLEDSWNIARDSQGREIVDRIFTGNPQLNVLTPFEYRRAVGSGGMHKTRYVQIFRLLDYDQWLDIYGQLGGKTRFFKDVQPVYAMASVYQFALRFYMRMMYVTPPAGEEYGTRWGSTMTGGLKHKVLVVEHYDEPHPLKWPEGRRVINANGACTHILKPDYNTMKLDGWHPLSEAQWMNAYPSSVASGPMQDLVKKNQELNVMDSFIATAMRRSLGGQYLIKIGSGIDPNRLVGEPGLAHEVTDPYGIRILHDELAIPPVVAAIREMQKTDAYDQSGALESQRGKSDEGNSGYQTKLFEEREEKRLAPARKAFRAAMAGAGEKLVYALHKNVIKLDDALMGYLISNASGEFTPQDVIAFLSKPLNIGTQINIVENSMVFKSTASMKADMTQMAQNPAVQQRLASDAKTLDKFLKVFGMEQLRDASAPQRERAERENEVFLDMMRLGKNMEGISRPIVIYEDDDTIHEDAHTDFIVQYWDIVRDNPDFLMEFYTHQERHRLQREEKAGKLLSGASMLTGQMVQMGSQQPTPTAEQVSLDTQMKNLQAQLIASQPEGAEMPKQGGAPPGAAPKSPTAPAATTQPGQKQGAQG
jgi:hypothetical protein